jgi:tetratricopeptide (TPR) repeat protein
MDETRPPRVFVVYSSQVNRKDIQSLTEELRAVGIDARFDGYAPVGERPRWFAQEIEEADFVLVVGTSYWAPSLQSQLAHDPSIKRKLIPVLLSDLARHHLHGQRSFRWPRDRVALLRLFSDRRLESLEPLQAAPPQEAPMASLADLLLGLYLPEELLRLASTLSPELSLPQTGSPAALAFALATQLRARGLVGPALFARLRADRPGRRAEIDSVEALWLGEAGALTEAPSTLELYHAEAFEAVARSLELASGFELQPVVLDGPDLARALADYLLRKGWGVVLLRCAGADWLRLESLLLEAPACERRVVLVLGLEWSSPEFHRALLGLNVRRDQITSIAAPLLWCGPPDLQFATAAAMPDFWSIRSTPFHVHSGEGDSLPLRLPALDPPPTHIEEQLAAYAAAEGSSRFTLGLDAARGLLRRLGPGDAAAALQIASEVVSLARGLEQGTAVVVAARACLELGRSSEAETWLASVPLVMNSYEGAQYDLIRGFQLASLELARAARWVEKAIHGFRDCGAPRGEAGALRLLAAIEDRRGQRRLARHLVATALQVADQARLPDVRAEALADLALLDRAMGRTEEADAELTEAAALFRSVGMHLDAFQAEARRSRAA